MSILILQRKDLAKEFSLVVQQEIINHNNAIAYTNSTLSVMSERLDKIENKSIKDYGYFCNQMQLIDAELKNANENIAQLVAKSENKIRSLEYDTEVFLKCINELQTENESLNKAMIKLMSHLDDANRKNAFIGKSIDNSLQTTENVVAIFYSKMHADIEKFKAEIMQRPAELDKMQRDFTDKINSNKIDVEGIMKEIVIFKKTLFIMEKKMENIYTLIERLKGASV